MSRTLIACLAPALAVVGACGSEGGVGRDGGGDDAGSCSSDCSGHGSCVVTAAGPECLCEAGFHAEGLQCLPNNPTDPCAGVTCSGHGSCVATGGSASCACESGYHARGLACVLDCPLWVAGTVLDVPRAEVTGQVTIAGAAYDYQVAIGFRDANGEIAWIDVWSGTPYRMLLVPGTYDIVYKYRGGGGEATNPYNPLAVLRTGVGVSGTSTLDLDVPRAEVTGQVTIAGAAYDYQVAIGFRDANGEIAWIDVWSGTPYRMLLVPGTYDVVYKYRGGGGEATNPYNPLAVLRTGVGVSGVSTLDLDVPRAEVTGQVTIAGAAYDYQVDIGFRDANGEIAWIDVWSGTPYRMLLVPGTYDIVYKYRGGGGEATNPYNPLAVLRTGVGVSGTSTLDLDVPRAEVTGQVTIAGAAYDYQVAIGFRDANGEIAWIDVWSGTPYRMLLVPGTYDIVYKYRGGGGEATNPYNSLAVLRTGVGVSGTSTLDLDVPRAEVTGQVTIAGAAYDYQVAIGFRDANGEIAWIDVWSGTPYRMLLVPGTYDVVYKYRGGGGEATNPYNPLAVLRTGVGVSGVSTLDLDVPRAEATGQVTIAGAAYDYQVDIGFRDADGEIAWIDVWSGTPYRMLLVPGTYDIVYKYRGGGGEATNPYNRNVLLGCYDVR